MLIYYQCQHLGLFIRWRRKVEKETREVPKPVGSSTPPSNAILSEFRSIFAPYKQVSPVPLMSTFQQPKNRPSKQKQRGVFFQPKETWTHEFFCLAQKGHYRKGGNFSRPRVYCSLLFYCNAPVHKPNIIRLSSRTYYI